ncbi:hypothetical protein GmHk_20G057796 [Glycine max]|nr:hypothetical protein GmHk_20G057796 [Glycine max]
MHYYYYYYWFATMEMIYQGREQSEIVERWQVYSFTRCAKFYSNLMSRQPGREPLQACSFATPNAFVPTWKNYVDPRRKDYGRTTICGTCIIYFEFNWYDLKNSALIFIRYLS